jgi:hypothetical protein
VRSEPFRNIFGRLRVAEQTGLNRSEPPSGAGASVGWGRTRTTRTAVRPAGTSPPTAAASARTILARMSPRQLVASCPRSGALRTQCCWTAALSSVGVRRRMGVRLPSECESDAALTKGWNNHKTEQPQDGTTTKWNNHDGKTDLH